MGTRTLPAAILCLMPAFVAAENDTGPDLDIKAIRIRVEQYAKAVNTCDLKLFSQIWSHSPEVPFIYPLGEKHGFNAIWQHVFQNAMGGMFPARNLEPSAIEIHVSGDAGWSEFHWTFHATLRKYGSSVTTHGVETQVNHQNPGRWRLVHVHYSEDRQFAP